MQHGWIKVAAATPKVRVADVAYNVQQTISMIQDAYAQGAKLIVFPELGITAYTCGDLFLQSRLISSALEGAQEIARETAHMDILSVVGLPLSVAGKLYNTAAFIKGGRILGFATKSHLPNYSEFYEMRHFNTLDANTTLPLFGRDIPIGPKLLFYAENYEYVTVAAEICEDLWVASPPGAQHALCGATILVNPSASDEIIAKADYRRMLVAAQSAKTATAYVYADAGEGESTTDMVFGGHDLIYEDGTLVSESRPFSQGILYGDIDLERLIQERRRITTFQPVQDDGYCRIPFALGSAPTSIHRRIDPHPFVPGDKDKLQQRCEEIFSIQFHGLKKRLNRIGAQTVTLGISGGLDSTLALLVTARAFDDLGLPRSGIEAVTMPCFGTTDRTYQNAKNMVHALGAHLREVDIRESVTLHLRDIGADIADHDVTYENAQARERTQVLMDIANKTGGIVIGTGDLSELALGFATYNGDHMSMYGVNASVPKTLVRHLVGYVAGISESPLREILLDVLDTPVSPELLPPQEDGSIAQQTEEIVGPYELHDFFLYYTVRWGYDPEKIKRMALLAFDGKYDETAVQYWLDTFLRRFFASQFKRSCLPDGPKVGSVALSPRGDWRMPSDAERF